MGESGRGGVYRAYIRNTTRPKSNNPVPILSYIYYNSRIYFFSAVKNRITRD